MNQLKPNPSACVGHLNPYGSFIDYEALEKELVEFPNLDCAEGDEWKFDLREFQGLQRRAGLEPQYVAQDIDEARDFVIVTDVYVGLEDIIYRVNHQIGINILNR